MAEFKKKNAGSNDYIVITNQIKDGNLKNLYLLHGSEIYLMLQYRDNLLKAFGASASDDTMNYASFSGSGIDINEVINLADTMPFFADYRTIVISDSGLFKNSPAPLVNYIKNGLPDTTRLLFVEGDKVKKDNFSKGDEGSVSKSSALYKIIKEKGTVAEFTELDEETTKKWVLGKVINPSGKKIRGMTLDYFIQKTGTDMGNIKNEMEKLICYIGDRDEITVADVDAIVTVRLKDRVFEMIDAMTSRQQKKALLLYYDLLAMKAPVRIISSNMINQFNGMLQVKELRLKGYPEDDIVGKMGLRAGEKWKVSKYGRLSERYTPDNLRAIVRELIETDEKIKTGLLPEQLAIEMLIVKYSSPA